MRYTIDRVISLEEFDAFAGDPAWLLIRQLCEMRKQLPSAEFLLLRLEARDESDE
jgi:hypothetical protein